MAATMRSASAAAGSPPELTDDRLQTRLAELLAGLVLRLGHAVGKQQQVIAAGEGQFGLRVRSGPRAAGRAACRSSAATVHVPSADRCRLSTWPALTNRAAPVAGSRSRSAAVTYFSGDVAAKSSSLAPGGQRPSATRPGRAAPAASPACCSSRATPAGPCPTRRPRRTAADWRRRHSVTGSAS